MRESERERERKRERERESRLQIQKDQRELRREIFKGEDSAKAYLPLNFERLILGAQARG